MIFGYTWHELMGSVLGNALYALAVFLLLLVRKGLSKAYKSMSNTTDRLKATSGQKRFQFVAGVVITALTAALTIVWAVALFRTHGVWWQYLLLILMVAGQAWLTWDENRRL